jgi:cell filamentation protein
MNGYAYIDPDYTYSYPKIGVLRNKETLKRKDLLLAFESFKCSKRLEELRKRPIRIKDSSSLLDIHKYLFQDVYIWAGEKRTVEISKEGKQFFPVNRFDTAFAYIDSLISEYKIIDKKKNTPLTLTLQIIRRYIHAI